MLLETWKRMWQLVKGGEQAQFPIYSSAVRIYAWTSSQFCCSSFLLRKISLDSNSLETNLLLRFRSILTQLVCLVESTHQHNTKLTIHGELPYPSLKRLFWPYLCSSRPSLRVWRRLSIIIFLRTSPWLHQHNSYLESRSYKIVSASGSNLVLVQCHSGCRRSQKDLLLRNEYFEVIWLHHPWIICDLTESGTSDPPWEGIQCIEKGYIELKFSWNHVDLVGDFWMQTSSGTYIYTRNSLVRVKT